MKFAEKIVSELSQKYLLCPVLTQQRLVLYYHALVRGRNGHAPRLLFLASCRVVGLTLAIQGKV